jgi:ankyrin repeat protein
MAGSNYLGASSVLIAGLIAAGPPALADTDPATPNSAAPASTSTPAVHGDSALVLAARYGQRDTVRLLLDQGTAVDSRDGLGWTALIAAAGERDKDIVALLLSRGASVAATDADGATALLHAATKGYLDNVRLLLEAGAAIEAVDGNGETALTAAVRFDHVAVVDYLLGHGADPNHYTPGEKNAGYTPLMRAVARDVPATDGLALVRSLLGKGAEPNVARANGETALSLARRNGADTAAEELLRHGARDETPYASLSPEQTLFKAIKLGDADKVGALLAGTVDPNYRDPLTGVTPLASAAYYGSVGLMELLIDHGADIDNVPWGLSEQRIEVSSVPVRERDLLRQVASGDTALLTSVRRGDLDAVWALLDKGADIRLPNRNGDTPALVAARNGQTDVMRALLTKGLDPNAAAPAPARGYVISSLVNKGTPPTLLMEAVRNDHAELCAILLEAGAQPDVADRQGKTALYWAVADGHADVVDALLTHGADPNIAARSGSTPLMVAAQNGSDAIAQALLEHGAGVNAIGGEADAAAGGMTALMYAARGGHAAIVGMLLQRGADPRLHAANGEEAVDTARENGHADVVNLLTAAVVE